MNKVIGNGLGMNLTEVLNGKTEAGGSDGEGGSRGKHAGSSTDIEDNGGDSANIDVSVDTKDKESGDNSEGGGGGNGDGDGSRRDSSGGGGGRGNHGSSFGDNSGSGNSHHGQADDSVSKHFRQG